MDDVRRSVAVLAARVRDAHAARVWLPLGHSSWGSYCRAESGISRAQAYRLLDVARSLAAIHGAITASTETSRRRCIVHSDRGSQFRSRRFVAVLARHSMIGSMGRVGAAGDNAAMESFFALLQKNILDRRTWATRQELRIAIVTWIERTYHRRRRQKRLARLTPSSTKPS